MSDKNIGELFDEFLNSGVDDGQMSKKADVKDAEEIAKEVENPKESADGESYKQDAKESGEDLEGANGSEPKTGVAQDEMGTMGNNETPSTTKVQEEKGKPMPEQAKQNTPDQNNGEQTNKGEQKSEGQDNGSEDTEQKTAGEDTLSKTASVLEDLEEHIKDRFQSEELLKTSAEEFIGLLKEEIQSSQNSQMDQLASLVSQRQMNKQGADTENKNEKNDKNKGQSKGSSDNAKSDKPTEGSQKDNETEATESAEKANDEKESQQTDASSETPESEGESSDKGEGEAEVPASAPAPAEGAMGAQSDMIPMEQLPAEVQEQINTLVSDLAAKTGLPEDTVLEELNAVSEEVMGKMSSEELVENLNKSAKEARFIQLTDELDKLSSEIKQSKTAAGDEMSEEAPAKAAAAASGGEEGAASEAAEAIASDQSPEEDSQAAAQAALENLSQEEIEALNQAVSELEEQGVPAEMIEDAVGSVVSGDVPEDVQKVSSEDEFSNLPDEKKIPGYVFLSLQGAKS